MPRLFIISGCNGSGKTTASYTLLPDLLDCREYVNSDEFAKSLSPFDPSAAAVVASRYMLQRIEYLLARNADFGIETTLATRSLVKIIEKAREKGYTIVLLYFWLSSPEIAIERIRSRVSAGGHNIPDDVVRRRYHMGLEYFFSTYAPLSDKWILADNSMPQFEVIAEGGVEGIKMKDEEKFNHVKNLSGVFRTDNK